MLKVLADPIAAKDPEQAERNAEFLELVKAELRRRSVEV